MYIHTICLCMYMYIIKFITKMECSEHYYTYTYVCTMQSSVSHDPQDVDSATCMLRMTEVTHTLSLAIYSWTWLVRRELNMNTRRGEMWMFVCHMCSVAPQTHDFNKSLYYTNVWLHVCKQMYTCVQHTCMHAQP